MGCFFVRKNAEVRFRVKQGTCRTVVAQDKRVHV